MIKFEGDHWCIYDRPNDLRKGVQAVPTAGKQEAEQTTELDWGALSILGLRWTTAGWTTGRSPAAAAG